MQYNWLAGDAGNDLREQRIREIEARMNAFLRQKEGVAECSTISKVQAARQDLRQLKPAS